MLSLVCSWVLCEGLKKLKMKLLYFKKIGIIVFIVSLCTFSFPVFVQASQNAQTVQELKSEISKLLTQISLLQIQIKILKKKAFQNGDFFNKDLKQGDRNNDVKKLQEVLNDDHTTQVAEKGPGSPGNETDFFGFLTKRAVIRFQEKYADEILTPINLMEGTGIVGFLTRKKLNEVVSRTKTTRIKDINSNNLSIGALSNTSGLFIAKPQITSISPAKGINGDIVTITGEGFTAEGNTVQTTFFTLDNISSIDGKTISFKFYSDVINDLLNTSIIQQEGSTVENVLAESAADPTIPQEAIPPSDMSFLFPVFISVKNQNGESNTVKFELDMDPQSQTSTSPINISMVSRVKEIFSNIISFNPFIKKAEASSRWWRRFFKRSKNSATNKFRGLGGSVGSIIGPDFGGMVVAAIPCLCSGSVAFTIAPVGGSPGPYNVSYWSTAIKANYAIKPGSWVLGSSAPAGVCSIYSGVWCFPFPARDIPPIPGVGTSL
jgi:peptidoglycan hydrolase-like protein with peptidoglycan-binding domain